MNTATLPPVTDRSLSLAERFPATYRQMIRERDAIPASLKERSQKIRSALVLMQGLQKGDTEFEAILYSVTSEFRKGSASDARIEEAISEAQKKSMRSGPVHVFIQMPGDISVAVSPEDFKDIARNGERVEFDSDGSERSVWTRTVRGLSGLVTSDAPQAEQPAEPVSMA